MSRQDSFAGQVWKNGTNKQKLVTVPKNSDIEEGEEVRVISLGNFREDFNREDFPGHYAYAELSATVQALRDAVNVIPDSDVEELSERFDFFEKWETEISPAIYELREHIDRHYGVMDHGGIKQLSRNKEEVVEKMKEADREIDHKLDQLKEEFENVANIEYPERQNYNIVTTEDGTEYRAPKFVRAHNNPDQKVEKLTDEYDDAPDSVIEYVKQVKLTRMERLEKYSSIAEEYGWEGKMEVVGRDQLVYKFMYRDAVMKVPYYFPSIDAVTIEEQ